MNGAPLNGTPTPNSIDGITDNRGFTGHEMLDLLDLVHMNGRIYDPLLGKFLSADPLIQDPMNGQSYNRYSYVLNNPTNLTDPTGFASQCGTTTGSNIPTCSNDSGSSYVQVEGGPRNYVMNNADGSRTLVLNNSAQGKFDSSGKPMNSGTNQVDPKTGGASAGANAEGPRLSDQIPGVDGKPVPTRASSNDT